MKKHLIFIISLSITILGLESRADTFEICRLFHGIYQNELQEKVKSGVPFELMSSVAQGQSILSKKSLNISFDLWDNIVIYKMRNQWIGKSSLEKAEEFICRHLQPHIPTHLKGKGKLNFRIYLNPMWSQRLSRLRLSTAAELENKRLVEVNWSRIESGMQSEKVLMEEEFEP